MDWPPGIKVLSAGKLNGIYHRQVVIDGLPVFSPVRREKKVAGSRAESHRVAGACQGMPVDDIKTVLLRQTVS